jgi:uncharacterized protein YciI
MSQVTETIPQTMWVLVSSIHDNTKEEDLVRIVPQVIQLVDEWQSEGRFIWSGPLSDNKTGIAIFEGTKEDADRFSEIYGSICSGILNFEMYKWDAIPFLSMFENKNPT